MKMHKNMSNLEVAELLRAVAAAYQLKDEDKNKFRIIAYQRAADATEHASSELKDLWDEGKLDDIPGVGKSIALHLDELFRTGNSNHFADVMQEYPPQLFDLMEIPGIGAKTAYKLVGALGISNKEPLKELEKLAKEGRIASIEGFGEQSQQDILTSLSEFMGRTRRHLLPYASNIALEVIEWLRKNKFVKKADPLGSLRRRASTIGDVDIAVATDNPGKVLEHFIQYSKAQRVLEKGEKTASIIVPSDVQVDLMVQPPAAYGALLQHFTGSKHHNIALREYALKKGLSLSEYGIRKKGEKVLRKFSTEEEFYNYLGLSWIPPELREDNGEIAAAIRQAQGKIPGLPELIELADVKSDLQIHSSFDIETSHDLGESSMQELVQKADALNYEYIAFTEHNPSHSQHTEKQIIDLLEKKKNIVDKINSELVKNRENNNHRFKSIRKVFNSLEIDILPSGKLPVSEEGLKLIDFALVSIHSSFRQSRDQMTSRILKGMSHPKVKIFAHPTARKLGYREGIEFDWKKVFDFCKTNNKWLEVNSDPMRLDLPDFLVKEAIDSGVKLTLGTDAHHEDGMDNMTFGISVARRGWATKADVANTRGLEEFEKMIL